MTRPAPRAILLDMDGVLYHGERPLPGAATFLGRLAATPFVLVTNNPIRPPAEIAGRLAAMGLPCPDPTAILTSAEATARWLARTHPGFRFFAVGAPGLHAALGQVGFEDPQRADFVVIGEGPGLDFEQLTIGINLILQRGARLIATNPDTTVDAVRDGHHLILPGGGALVAPFAAATGVTPTVIGKPEPLLYEMALERLGCPAGACLMIGDRPDTDIAGAARLGMWTALVRTGRFAPGAPWPTEIPVPDWDLVDLAALTRALEATCPDLLAGKAPGAPG
ncbi:HAD-IIA family hydrolase [Thiococcus pfennigii]|uniref:HAD-IIA family hydrolase n=1 Tax=Thiococcus pfennigii TaxID=1057 RepID=UPI001905866E|nr:HAD-IIA family hydrolase [Thiococcus pfennigii]MBK1733066.1 haloacid dehalogenase [Thiococcus pfennigii]